MVDFDAPDLVQQVEKLAPEEIDELPFGSIRLDQDLRVTFYSLAEGRLSGYGDRPAIGRIFFSEIAPCMSNELFLGRIDQARARGTLDMEFGWIGDFSDPNREIRVRVRSAGQDGIWIFLQRPA
jgi:photoactive yellow protein